MADEENNINNTAGNAVVPALELAEVTTHEYASNQGISNNHVGVVAKNDVRKLADDRGGGRVVDADAGIEPLANVAQDMGTTDTGTVPTIPPPIVASRENPQFGITQATLLAPVPPPPKKKRKTQDEFTISQKLEILSELKGPNALSVPDLAAKHNTSRTSVYRWKKDAQRLHRLARKDGKGQYKRVAHKRKCYNEEYTAAEKLAVVRELHGKDAPSVRTLAERCGANHRSIYRWKKDEARLVKLVEEEGRGGRKRVGDDPLHRIKEALKAFHANNYVDADSGLQVGTLTGTILALKARQIRDEMLAQDQKTPFLTDEEAKGMREFTASGSWGRKIVNKFGWKTNNTAADAAPTTTNVADPPVNADSIDIDNLATLYSSLPNAVPTVKSKKSQKPPSAASQRKVQKAAEMKREIISLKRKLNGAESRVRDLEADNTQLRAQIVTLMNRNNESTGETVPMTAMYDGLNAAVALDPSIDGVAEIAMVEGATNVANEDAIDEQGVRIEI